jgi:hypothetical protein
MQKQPTQGGTPELVEQPAVQEVRKKNAWWRQPKINRSVRRLPYVISEGEVWFGRKVPGGRAWTWLEASESSLAEKPTANDRQFKRPGGK